MYVLLEPEMEVYLYLCWTNSSDDLKYSKYNNKQNTNNRDNDKYDKWDV